MDVSSLQHFGIQATLTQEQPYVVEHCLDEESTINEVLVISTGYDQGAFPVPFCNTPYLSMFLEARHVNRPPLSNQRRWPTLLCPLTFTDELFSILDSLQWSHASDLTFCLRIIMMNPGFVNSYDMREIIWILGDSCQIFWTHWMTMLYIFSLEEMRNPS